MTVINMITSAFQVSVRCTGFGSYQAMHDETNCCLVGGFVPRARNTSSVKHSVLSHLHAHSVKYTTRSVSIDSIAAASTSCAASPSSPEPSI
jgi:hypothetical protein